MKWVLIILLFVSTAINAQLISGQNIAKYSLIFVAGAADGVNQTLLFHYDNFKRVHPDANDQFWDPFLSYTNKGNTLFGKTFGASFSDGYHLTRWFDRNSMLASGTLVILSNGNNWVGYIADFLIGFLCRSIGFHLTYSIIYHE